MYVDAATTIPRREVRGHAVSAFDRVSATRPSWIALHTHTHTHTVYFPVTFFSAHKPDGQNELIAASDSEHDGGGDGGGGSDGTYQDPGLEREHRGSIAASFGPMVDAMRRYRAAGMAADMANEVAVPDTVIVGNRSDTYLTSVRVKGLRDVDGQTMIVSWKEDSVGVPQNARPKRVSDRGARSSFRSERAIFARRLQRLGRDDGRKLTTTKCNRPPFIPCALSSVFRPTTRRSIRVGDRESIEMSVFCDVLGVFTHNPKHSRTPVER